MGSTCVRMITKRVQFIHRNKTYVVHTNLPSRRPQCTPHTTHRTQPQLHEQVPFEVVGGNHDLEGIDEFPTDETNMEAYLSILGKPTPYFRRDIADKVVLLGLGSTAFRTAQYTSHEVYIDVRLNFGGVYLVFLVCGGHCLVFS